MYVNLIHVGRCIDVQEMGGGVGGVDGVISKHQTPVMAYWHKPKIDTVQVCEMCFQIKSTACGQILFCPDFTAILSTVDIHVHVPGHPELHVL